MLQQLELQTLAIRRQVHRLCLFHKAYYGSPALQIPVYILPAIRLSRRISETDFIPLSANRNYYQQSFFPRTVIDWNDLPLQIKALQELEPFKVALEGELYEGQ
jgi:hypothetical protein